MEATASSTGGESPLVSVLPTEITSSTTESSDHPILVPGQDHYTHGLLVATFKRDGSRIVP
jgi:hypothetical protein